MSEGTEFQSLEEEGDSSSLADAEQTLQQVQQELELVKSTQTSIERQFSRLFTALRASFSSAIEQSHEVLAGHLSTLALEIGSIDKRTRSLQTSQEEILSRVSEHEIALQESPGATVPGIDAIAEKAEALQVVQEKLLSQLGDRESVLRESLATLTTEITAIRTKTESLESNQETLLDQARDQRKLLEQSPAALSTDIDATTKQSEAIQANQKQLLGVLAELKGALEAIPQATPPTLVIDAIAEKAEALQVIQESLTSQLEDRETTLKEKLGALAAEVSTIGDKAESLAPSIEVITKGTEALRASQENTLGVLADLKRVLEENLDAPRLAMEKLAKRMGTLQTEQERALSEALREKEGLIENLGNLGSRLDETLVELKTVFEERDARRKPGRLWRSYRAPILLLLCGILLVSTVGGAGGAYLAMHLGPNLGAGLSPETTATAVVSPAWTATVDLSPTEEWTPTMALAPTETPTPTRLASLTPTTTRTATSAPTHTPTATARSAFTATPLPITQVTVTTANVRAGPGMTYDVLGRVHRGDEVQVVARTEDGAWFRVQAVSTALDGWIAADLIELHEAMDGIPIVTGDQPVPTATLT